MGGQPGKPKPPGNPPQQREPRPAPIEEPPTPIPVPPVERPPAPMQAQQSHRFRGLASAPASGLKPRPFAIRA